mmetsp:Transcript_6798/g.9708  ORF Transcript_6798/g.9708 Transcript_6798/m.9708 type:complete len:218 (+) Transcript_6798:167-820(+)
MSPNDIVRVAVTVAFAQAGCDLLATKLVFSKEPYTRAVSAMKRVGVKRDKAAAIEAPVAGKSAASIKAADKYAKKVQRAEDDFAEAAADVARRHTPPSFFTSLLFIILFRVLATEYSGKVVAVLPFTPFSILQRVTLRNLDAKAVGDLTGRGVSSASQACAFMFIYILCTMSVKFYVNKLLGTTPPKGADKGFANVLESPKSQRILKSMGADLDSLK